LVDLVIYGRVIRFLGIDWGEMGQVKVSAIICRHVNKYLVPYSATNLFVSRATVSF